MDASGSPIGTRAFAERFHQVATRVPGQVAATDLERRTTYDELAHAVTTTALAILAADAPPGPALVAADDTFAFVTGMLAAAATGRSCVVTGRQLSASTVREFARQTGAALLLGAASPERLRAGLPVVEPDPLVPTISPTMRPTTRTMVGLERILEGRVAEEIDWSLVVSHTETSGSTGAPKLVEDVMATPWGRPIAPLDSLATGTHVATNLSASGAFRVRAAIALLSGSTFTGFAIDALPPSELLRRLDAAAVTMLSTTPTILRRLHSAARAGEALRRVTEVTSIGEPLRWSDVRLARELCGSDVTVVNRFGSTEAGIVTELRVASDARIADGRLSVGRAVPGRHVWIAGDDARPVATGVVGRIVIEGVFTTRVPGLEALADGVSRLWSSDLGRLDQHGELWFEGRADRMVKVAGARVEPAAVEDVLRALPGVIDVAVLPAAVAADEWRLVAHVVFAGDPPDAVDLRNATAEKVIPIAVPVRFFLRRDPLPLLPSGKVDAQALIRLATSDNDEASTTPDPA